MKVVFRLLLLSFLFSGCVIDDPGDSVPDGDDGSIVRVGDRLPSFSVRVYGTDSSWEFSSEHLTGTTFIVFFNTSCKDCQRELPKLNDYYLRNYSQPGFQMVAIAREEQEESIKAFWDEHGLSIPFSPQPDRSVYSLFASLTIPRVYKCGKDGVVEWMGIEKFTVAD